MRSACRRRSWNPSTSTRPGFSPQIADELGDPDYLDPNGVNRRFIILTPSQSTLPVVHTRFSNTEALMYEFFTRMRARSTP